MPAQRQEIEFDIDLTEFESALRSYQDATGKEIPEIVNRAARNIAFKAASKTKLAPLGKINRFNPDKRPEKKPQRMLYALTAKDRPAGGTDGGRAAKAFNRRKASRGYIKAGWFAVLRKMGVRTRVRPSDDLRYDAEWIKATFLRHVAIIGNAADGADQVGLPALRWAVSVVAKDMEQYAAKKLGKIADDHSAK